MKKWLKDKKLVKEAIKDWENSLVNYKAQKKRFGYKSTDLLPLQLGWSVERSIDWIEEELRLLREALNKPNSD